MSMWAIVPAAGVGTRMAADIPKQYLAIGKKTVIAHTLDKLLDQPLITGIYVAIAASDPWWPTLECINNDKIHQLDGGKERCFSVLNALQALSETAQDDDWVLVHDAARPCVRAEDIEKLIQHVSQHEVGGLLGIPVKDTMKRTDATANIQNTVERQLLWHAYTPQMFRLGMLKQALTDAIAAGALVTDEASAIEWAGYQPLMVAGHADNIKITEPDDLRLAEFYLSRS